ncbi:MAG TPA: AAA family ATPase [Pyrinomonadaceae bacterium]|nr:AAA family ATPase [Pyrinomonadaceae bacterium]
MQPESAINREEQTARHAPQGEPYADSREHLFDELRRLDLMLNLRVARQRQDPSFAGFNEFRGLFITEDEVDFITGRKGRDADLDASRNGQHEAELNALAEAIEQMERSIAMRTTATLRAGRQLSLLNLAELFQLAPFDLDVLLLCLAPELDVKYEKLYAYLQNDVTRKKPSIDLILNLFCRSLDEKVKARSRLTKEAPLLRHDLLVFATDAQREEQSLLSKFVKLDSRVFNFILGIDGRDEQLSGFTRLIEPRVNLADSLLPTEMKERLADFLGRSERGPQAGYSMGERALLFEGAGGVGKKFLAEALCQQAGLKLLVADAALLLAAPTLIESRITRLFREARMIGAALYLDNSEALLEENEQAVCARRTILSAFEGSEVTTFIGSARALEEQLNFDSDRAIKISLPVPGFTERRTLWLALLEQSEASLAPDIEIEGLAARFKFTAGRIRQTITEAKHQARLRSPERVEISSDDLYAAARAQGGQKLATLARKITPLYKWEDIILPADRMVQLREVCAHALHHQRVFEEWGFNRKISRGRGLSVLFVGESGTGKTMAAEIIAGELKLDLYKIDLSCMVSKYIGETEKNLSRIFAAAEESNAVLFFDEADAIFGKRSEVKDSHDRYANIEVNYLLQRMEDYEGTIILASNFQKNIDESFTRRLRFIIEFPFPEADHRRRIWQNMFPPGIPLDPELDWDFLSRKMRLTGGSIKNIALGSAFLAANNSGHIGMKQIISAVKREFQKTGRLCVKADFEQYYELVIAQEEEVLR